jgi:hypothetical protein
MNELNVTENIDHIIPISAHLGYNLPRLKKLISMQVADLPSTS